MRVKKIEEDPIEIPLIPMIDCMLVIIIFFLVATTMKNAEKELPLELPQSDAAVSIEQKPDLVVVGVDRDGHTYFGNNDRIEPVDNERLHQYLREVAQRNPNQRLRIDGDRDTRYEDIIHVVDLCQFEGLKNIGLHTKKERGK
jgi:biopolymer transport protein ExbD